MSTKISVVTGGSRGLGKNTALHLARKGVDVILTYHSKTDEAETVVGEIKKLGRKALAIQLDVGKSATFADFASQVKTLLADNWQRNNFDYLINNAGIGIHASFTETSESQFDQLVDIHLKGPFFLTQHLLPLIADQGSIVNLSSGLSRFSLPGYIAYGAIERGH
jgi:NAD(P)-dependent dehydrogenase (short-subunit alcohol dehydrogenase family)